MLIEVRIPASILSPTVPVLEIGIIQNMTVENKRKYDEDTNEHIFEFKPNDVPLLDRVFSRMFGQNESQIKFNVIIPPSTCSSTKSTYKSLKIPMLTTQ